MTVRFVDREPDESAWVDLHRAADRHVPDARRAFLGAVEEARGRADVGRIERTLRDSPRTAILTPDWDAFRANLSEGQRDALDAAFQAGGRVEAERVGDLVGLPTKLLKQGPVDLNRASFEELLSLSGVGPVTARRIISERERLGGFANVAHLLNQVPHLAGSDVLRWAEDGDAVLGGRELFPAFVTASGETIGVGLTGAFDLTNPRAVRIAREEAASLVQGITARSQGAMRDVLERAQVFGLNTRQQASELAEILNQTIGLDSKRAVALLNYDRSLAEAGVSNSRRRRLVRQRRRRLLRQRATVIARNETLNIAGEGQRQIWDQAVRRGLLPPDQLFEWVTTPDDRTCAICRPMGAPTGERQIRALNEPFVSPFNGVSALRSGGAHVQCRCVVVTVDMLELEAAA